VEHPGPGVTPLPAAVEYAGQSGRSRMIPSMAFMKRWLASVFSKSKGKITLSQVMMSFTCSAATTSALSRTYIISSRGRWGQQHPQGQQQLDRGVFWASQHNSHCSSETSNSLCPAICTARRVLILLEPCMSSGAHSTREALGKRCRSLTRAQWPLAAQADDPPCSWLCRSITAPPRLLLARYAVLPCFRYEAYPDEISAAQQRPAFPPAAAFPASPISVQTGHHMLPVPDPSTAGLSWVFPAPAPVERHSSCLKGGTTQHMQDPPAECSKRTESI